MKKLALVAAASFALSACGAEPEDPDTQYEETMPEPVPQGGEAGAPVPDQTSMEGGPDERADEAAVTAEDVETVDEDAMREAN